MRADINMGRIITGTETERIIPPGPIDIMMRMIIEPQGNKVITGSEVDMMCTTMTRDRPELSIKANNAYSEMQTDPAINDAMPDTFKTQFCCRSTALHLLALSNTA